MTVLIAVLLAVPAPRPALAAPLEPEAVLGQMESALNAGNYDAFVAWFAPDGVIQEQGGTVVGGREQLRVYAQGLASRNYRAEAGKRERGGPVPGTAVQLKWTARVTFDGLKALGVDAVEAKASAVVDNGKVKSYTPAFSPGAMAMMATAASVQQESFIRAFYEEVVNQGKLESLGNFVTEGFVDHAPLPGRPPSSTGFREGLADLRGAMPDFRVAVEDVFSTGDRVVVRSTWTGTHKGPYQGSPATFRNVSVGAIDILRIEDGRIAERWEQLDSGGLARQLGLFDAAPASAPSKSKKRSAKKGNTGGILGWLNDL